MNKSELMNRLRPRIKKWGGLDITEIITEFMEFVMDILADYNAKIAKNMDSPSFYQAGDSVLLKLTDTDTLLLESMTKKQKRMFRKMMLYWLNGYKVIPQPRKLKTVDEPETIELVKKNTYEK